MTEAEGTQGTEGTGKGGEWRAQLPADLKENEAFSPHKTLGDFAKAHLETAGKVKEHEGKVKELEGKVAEMIPKLPENATDEEREVFWASMGKPETAEGYEIPEPEGGKSDPTVVKWAQQTFHKANLSKEQAAVIGKEWGLFTNEIVKADIKANEDARVAAEKKLKEECGSEEKYKAATELADRVWKKSTGVDFASFLKENGLIKNPYPIIKVIIDLAKKTGEDLSPAGRPAGMGADKAGMDYSKSPAP